MLLLRLPQVYVRLQVGHRLEDVFQAELSFHTHRRKRKNNIFREKNDAKREEQRSDHFITGATLNLRLIRANINGRGHD